MTNKANWEVTNKRFVAFFYILGFKELVMRNSHENIYGILHKIASARHELENMNNQHDFDIEEFLDSEVYIVNFSDSIIIFSKNDKIDDFNYFNFAVTYLFSYIIDLNLPVKASVAHGEISVNKSAQIYFGQPIIDAYLLEEETNYLGIVAHHSIDSYYNDSPEIEKRKLTVDLFSTKTPLKSGMITHLNYNWFREYFSINSSKMSVNEFENRMNTFYNNVSGTPRKYIDNTKELFERVFLNKQIK